MAGTWNDTRTAALAAAFKRRGTPESFFNELAHRFPTVSRRAVLEELWPSCAEGTPEEVDYFEQLMNYVYPPAEDLTGFVSYELVKFRFDHARPTLLKAGWTEEELAGHVVLRVLTKFGVASKLQGGTRWFEDVKVDEVLAQLGEGVKEPPLKPKVEKKKKKKELKVEKKESGGVNLAQYYVQQHKDGLFTKEELFDLLKGINK